MTPTEVHYRPITGSATAPDLALGLLLGELDAFLSDNTRWQLDGNIIVTPPVNDGLMWSAIADIRLEVASS